MAEGKVKANNIEIWYEDFGDPGNTTVLFIRKMYRLFQLQHTIGCFRGM